MQAPKQTLQLAAGRPESIARAARILRDGGIVAFPTETVYGLGANALDAEAVSRIFLAKQRPSWDPLIVHISDRSMLDQVATLSGPLRASAERLMDAFWPGPLTLLLPRTGAIPDAVTAGRPRVGVRMPSHPVALSLITQAGIPVAAPSANRFGHTSPTTSAHVLQDLDGCIDAVLDGGATSVGVESTVLDVCEHPMRLYRPGAITLEQIAAVGGAVELFRPDFAEPSAIPASLPSPGLDLRHYAPHTRLVLVETKGELMATSSALSSSGPVGVMLPDGWDPGAAAATFYWGPWHDPPILAQRLFAGLRELDNCDLAIILCPLPPDIGGLSAAMRDRLLKAARPR